MAKNHLIVPEVEQMLEQMKYEIAQELNIEFGADATSRDNGRIGGEITKRLVQIAQQNLK